MKLVFYSPQFLPSVGGLQNIVHYWAIGLAGLDHDIVVICTTPGDADESLPYRVFRSPDFGQTVSLMREAQLVVMFNVSLKAIPQWLLSRTPLVISHHSAYRYPGRPASWLQKLKKQVSNLLARGNIACSTYIAGDYRNCAVVPNTYQADLFFDRKLERQVATILFVGRMVTDKGSDLLLEAVARLQQKGRSFSTTIVGDGPESENAREKASCMQRVVFKAPLPSHSIAELMNQHAIVVVPSRLEPFGIVVLEALACGCEVVASLEGGLPEAGEALTHYFTSGSAASLADTLVTVLDGKKLNFPEQRMIHLARFSPEFSTACLDQTLHQLLAG